MTTTSDLMRAVEEAWAEVPAPPLLELRLTGWGLSQEEADAFVDLAPMEVDIDSVGFLMAEFLFDLPPEAAAAYLGTFLRAVMQSLRDQERVGVFGDALTRAHLITCLKDRGFWEEVIAAHLTGRRLEVLLDVVEHLVRERKALGLDDGDIGTLRARVSGSLRG
ncbi:hypothetical protein [Pyxidicoccus xibeiensis]|uniref:hypothetical protein n=1 Tax=Pyxidicoccus xibeiensis TaxID=2906759 RepID=UPI0020A7BA6D|nr:hypothetical protein [Pyxidicoccus xibeiensis]MCP3140208.1 hypothetical protein [Pyxidicoccus xibeiensis]